MLLSAPFLALARRAGGGAVPRVLLLGQFAGGDTGEDVYLYDSSTGLAPLLYHVDGGQLLPVAVSSDGSVLVVADYVLVGGKIPVYVWRDGILQTYYLDDSAPYADVFCASDDGTIVAGAGPLGATVWTNGAVTATYGANGDYFTGMSGDGSVLALQKVGATLPRIVVAGVETPLGALDGAALSISNNGRYVQGYRLQAGPFNSPFVYDRDTDTFYDAAPAYDATTGAVSDSGIAETYSPAAPHTAKLPLGGASVALPFNTVPVAPTAGMSADARAFLGRFDGGTNGLQIDGAAPLDTLFVQAGYSPHPSNVIPAVGPLVLMLGQLPGEEYGEDVYLYNSRTDARTLVANVPGGSLAPVGISPDGTVQCVQDFTLDAGQAPIYVWRGGVLTTYLLADGGAEARACSDDGNIIVGAGTTGATVWDEGVPTVYGVAGDSFRSVSGDGTRAAWQVGAGGVPPRLLVDGVMQEIGVVEGGVQAVSNNGVYAAGYVYIGGDPFAFVYNIDTTATVTAAVTCNALAVSDAGIALVYGGLASPSQKMLADGSLVNLALDSNPNGNVNADGRCFRGRIGANQFLVIDGGASIDSGLQSTDGNLSLVSNVLP